MSNVKSMEERPPYVRFELRAIEDRDATIKAGHFVGKDVIFALVTPRGSKDVHEAIAEDWLAKLAREVQEERFPANWLEQYKQLYSMYKSGVEAPIAGMSLKNWPGITPSQLRTCHALRLYSVEDLASTNEEAIQALGMGARALSEKAKQYLLAAAGPGAAASTIVAQTAAIADLTARNELLEGQVRALITKVGGLNDVAAPPSNVASITRADLLEDRQPPVAVRKL